MAQANDIRGVTLCMTDAGLVAGTTSTITTDTAVEGSIGGKFVTSYAAQTNTAPGTTDYAGETFETIPDDKGTVFVMSVDAAGALQIHQGALQSLDSSGDFITFPSFPWVDLDTYMPFGYIVIKNNSGTVFNFGATTWSTFEAMESISTLPLRPQGS
jgi:hypothetical protein|tara:strand:- start:1356 stop:1826 length:471 start_codon:yes stop_codon:yes gene_type:complete